MIRANASPYTLAVLALALVAGLAAVLLASGCALPTPPGATTGAAQAVPSAFTATV